MTEALDIEAILRNNPQVDKDVIRRRLEENEEGTTGRSRRSTAKGGSTSPYTGRRVIPDDRYREGAAKKQCRTGYGSK